MPILDISGGEIDRSALLKFARHAPSYCIYPAPANFNDDFRAHIERRLTETSEASSPPRTVNFNIRLPTPHDMGAKDVAGWLSREIRLCAMFLGGKCSVRDVHWSGDLGAYSPALIARLADSLYQYFPEAGNSPRRITIDPLRDCSHIADILEILCPQRIDLQPSKADAHPGAANAWLALPKRIAALTAISRRLQIPTIGGLAVYGVPGQSIEAFRQLCRASLEDMPEHFCLLDHAEIGRPPYGQLAFEHRPEALDMLLDAVDMLVKAGYVQIGQRHMARTTSALAHARMRGQLRLQLDGPGTRPAPVILAIGPGAIGAIGPAYYRNHRSLEDYSRGLDLGGLPVAAGKALSADDLLRRTIIQALVTDFFVDTGVVEIAYGRIFREYFSSELKLLAPAGNAGLIEWSDRTLQLTPTGRLAAGTIAMAFDACRPPFPA